MYTYPFYPPSHVLRVPPRNGAGGPLQWPMPSLHPAALAHQAVKDRLAGENTLFVGLDLIDKDKSIGDVLEIG